MPNTKGGARGDQGHVGSFPAGFETPPTDDRAPVDGLEFTEFGARAANVELRKTDVIVGIDGVRVRSAGQATVLLRASHDAAMTFTVWRDGAYTMVQGTLPQRRLGSRYRTYGSPPLMFR